MEALEKYIITDDKREQLSEECISLYKKTYSNDNMLDNKYISLCNNFIHHLCYEPIILITENKTIIFEYGYNDDYMYVEVLNDRYRVSHYKYGDLKIEFLPEDMWKILNMIKIFFGGSPKNSLLFTGAFNPPHLGHVFLIKEAVKRNFDYAFIAISNQKFIEKKQRKQNSPSKSITFSQQQRLDMILEMTYDMPQVLIFGVEEGYTYEVLCMVKEKYNLNELYFAMGSDKLNEINRWGFQEKLLSEFQFYVLLRGDDLLENVDTKCKEIFSNTKYIIEKDNEEYKDISSTLIRNKIYRREDYSLYVHKNVFDYISKGYSGKI